MKIACNYLLYVFNAFIMAAIYGVATYLIIYPIIVSGHILTAHVINFLLIIVTLLADKIEQKMMLKRKNNSKQNKFTLVLRSVLSPRIGNISFKTSLYLFYFATLIMSVVLRVDNVVKVTEYFRIYVFTLEYGVMFLIAADMFIKHLVIDSKHIRDMNNDSANKICEEDTS